MGSLFSVCFTDSFWCDALEHLTGAVALLLQLYGLAHPEDKRLRQMSVLAAIVFALNHFSVGAVGAMGVNLLLAVRTHMSNRLLGASQATRLFWFVLLSLGTTLALLLPGVTPLSLFLTLSALWIGYAYFFQAGVALRMSLGINKLLWLANAFAYDSEWQVLLCMLGAGASFFGAWRVTRGAHQKSLETPSGAS